MPLTKSKMKVQELMYSFCINHNRNSNNIRIFKKPYSLLLQFGANSNGGESHGLIGLQQILSCYWYMILEPDKFIGFLFN